MRLPFTYKIADLLVRKNFEALETDPVPSAIAYGLAAQTIPSGFGGPEHGFAYRVNLSSFEFANGIDVGTTAGTNELTIKDPGLYLFWANIRWANNNVGSREHFISLNGAVAIPGAYCQGTPVSGTPSNSVFGMYRCKKDDKIRLVCAQTSGGNLAFFQNAVLGAAYHGP